MNWLITGGCGFLGTALIRELAREGGHRIRVVDDLSVGTREDLAAACEFLEAPVAGAGQISFSPSPIELVVGDLLDGELALRAAEGADVIVHLAANTGVEPSVQDPRTDCMSNVVGTLNYLEAARHNDVKRLVLASSGAALGEVDPPLHEEVAPHPASPYGASKLACEGYCSAYFRTFGVEAVALRFGNVYGPGSTHKNSAVARFTKRALQGEPLQIYGDGKQTRDFIYIEDLIRAVRLAATVEGVGGEVLQIATSAETSVQELIDQLLPILSGSGIEGIEVKRENPRQGDVMRNYADTSKARKILGWQPEVNLQEGLQRTVDWFMQETSFQRR